MPPGRPRHFDTAEEMQKSIDSFFDTLEATKKPPTITGLALHLGFCDRRSFYDYELNGDFSYTVKAARLKVERAYEENLHGPSATGSIFALKNFGWDDRSTNVIEGGDNPVKSAITVTIRKPGDTGGT